MRQRGGAPGRQLTRARPAGSKRCGAQARCPHAILPTCLLMLQLADTVEALLSDRVALAAVGRAALAQARSWAQHDNAQALVGHVQQALAAATAAT